MFHMSNTTVASRTAIDELEQRWIAAELHADVPTLASLFTDDFACVGPLGFVLDKAQYLGSRRSGDLKHAALTWDDLRVREYADTTLVIGSQRQQSTFQGRDASAYFRVTQVLVRVQPAGDWLIASLHFSPIAPLPGSPAA
jgi:ketosteroid isomerase-like protein